MEDDKLIEERKKKFISIIKKECVYISIVLVILLILGIYIRSLPLQINYNTGKPGLWDIAKNEWTLGPDLDPWLFTRYAKTMIETGSLPKIDKLRYIPLQYDTTEELQMVSYMIVLTYKLINPFYKTNIEFYAALMPVILFALTILAFFFFVREIFIRKDKNNLSANVIASISTLFMIIIPVFISRTVAGIPEKESVAFFFMFLAFFLYLKAWKTENFKIALIFALLAGISTSLMGLSWGGVIYIYVTIALASFAAFILNKVNKKEIFVYSIWILSSIIITPVFTSRFSLVEFMTSLDTGLSVLVFLIFIVDFICWKTNLSIKLEQNKLITKYNLPKQLWSIIFAGLLILIGASVIFGPSFIINKVIDLNKMLFRPIEGRWVITVAENRQPYFWEWAGSFGPVIGKIPILFWLFIIGSIVLFKQMLKSLKNKEAWIITAAYTLFLFALVFSRYSPTSIFNGEDFISKAFYYLSALIFLGTILYYYWEAHNKKDNSFESISFESIFIISLLVLCIFTARSAIRLVMTLGPIAPIFASYLLVYSWNSYKNKSHEEETYKIIKIVAVILVLLLLFYCLFGIPFNTQKYPGFYQQIKAYSFSSVPSSYTNQWQKAMFWGDNNTKKDSVFVHWWDYGYWLQSMGNRATVTDGGNKWTYWNYVSGRYVLTGDNQKDALDFFYSHNATHLLIDSSDLGKYGAFSSIGSDENFDRLSSGPITLVSDEKMIQEKNDGMVRYYQVSGVRPIEEDIIYELNGTKYNLYSQSSGLIGIKLEIKDKGNETIFMQPEGIFISNGKQISLPLRYLYYENRFSDFKTGIPATAYVIKRFTGTSIDPLGGAIYVSPRLMRGLLAQLYILNDPFKNFVNFKLVHVENDIWIDSINLQIKSGDSKFKLGEFAIINNGLQGPIKIWGASFSGNEQVRQEFLDTDSSKYLAWQL